MRSNAAPKLSKEYTHEGAVAYRISDAQALQRSVMSCMLFEKEFYEEGEEIAERIAKLIPKVTPETVALMALKARDQMKLRHMPLFLCCEMAKYKSHSVLLADTVFKVIQRADELAEILAIYSRGRTGTHKLNKLSKQLKLGIARAFHKFDEYQLAKYNRDNEIKLRDVLFLCHAKPQDRAQAKLWKKLVEKDLEIPDTWEVAISAAKPEEKNATWARLLKERKLGPLALIRNLRNLREAGVEEDVIAKALSVMKTERVLPFRFVTAARHNPTLEPYLEQAMLSCLAGFEKLPGHTCAVVDISGSMTEKLSAKSETTREDAATALAVLLREVCEKFTGIAFSDEAAIVPPRRGFALRDAINQAMPHNGTHTDKALFVANTRGYDRIIVFTDEQSHQQIREPLKGTKAYFINVASAKNGIGYGRYTHIDGMSENVLDFIRIFEQETR